jgi:Ca2+/H+ antiporter, TMEM165/GDT1 family
LNLGYAAATFALVIPAELPDKTFISAVILSSRHRAAPVWLGVASGLVVQAAIAVLAGRLLALLPHRTVTAVTGALFLLGALYLIFSTEKVDEDQGVELAAVEESVIVGDEATGAAVSSPAVAQSSFLKVAATSFAIVLVAEFGDLTQILIANLSARYRDPTGVFVGASLAFIVVSGAGVAAGRTLLRVVPLALIRKLSGLALLALGIWSVVDAIS